MSNKFSVGVVVPTYNRAHLISETLESILNQGSAMADDILVVDDGSTDNTREIVAKYPVRYTRIKNSGDLAARNCGTLSLNTELVAFCDSDDLWLPNHLENMVSLWKALPNLAAAYSDFRILKNGSTLPVSKFNLHNPPSYWDDVEPVSTNSAIVTQDMTEKLLEFQPFFPSCLVVHRQKFIKAGLWNEEAGRGADFTTALYFAHNPPFGVSFEPTVSIRKHEGNISADTVEMNLRDAHILRVAAASGRYSRKLAKKLLASARAREVSAFHGAFANGNKQLAASLIPSLGASIVKPKVFAKATLSLAANAFGRA